jgi:hypothetical protein
MDITDLDSSVAAADWTKATWDIWVGGHLVATIPDLLLALHVANEPEASQSRVVTAFLKLPAAEPMPAKLRTAVDAWLEEG